MANVLTSQEFVVFTTGLYAQTEGLTLSAASKKLGRLARKRFIQKIARGVWANPSHPFFTPLACVPYLLGKEHGYVSLLTALHRHGLMSQIPATFQVATTGHSRVARTSVGTFEFFQLKPELMRDGVQWSATKLPFLIASPEKALFDTFYLATRKGRRFSKLPELEFRPSDFKKNRFVGLLDQADLPSPIRTAIRARFDQVWEHAKNP